jgi:chromosome segregation ATPase
MEENETNDILETKQKMMEEAPKEPSRLGIFLRKSLRWVTGLAVVFVLGIILTWLVRVQPQAREMQNLRDRLAVAEERAQELEGADEENEQLHVELDAARLHLNLLSVLVDVSTAQLALANSDPLAAQEALADTDSSLASLEESVAASQVETVQNMRDRLTLVLDELEDDAFAAESDLDVLRNNILALEQSLFGD